MWVYILRSLSDPRRTYTGLAEDLEKRLREHNAGRSPHTSRYRPWLVEVAVQFTDLMRAREFEGYLKSGSGRAFAKKHFLSRAQPPLPLDSAPDQAC